MVQAENRFRQLVNSKEIVTGQYKQYQQKILWVVVSI